jgi:hypothetical protein
VAKRTDFKMLPKIQWAPLNVPLHRRLEMVAAASWIIIILFGEIICLTIFCAFLVSIFKSEMKIFCQFQLISSVDNQYWGNTLIKALCVIYMLFIYIDSDTGVQKGGRGQGQVVLVHHSFCFGFLKFFFSKNSGRNGYAIGHGGNYLPNISRRKFIKRQTCPPTETTFLLDIHMV